MCIAIYKPTGIDMPDKKTFKTCFEANDDGAGFMFPYNGKVHIEKGFMTYKAFKNALKKSIKKYGISQKQTPMVFHFRITTQGGVQPELTHPFSLSRDYEDMRKLVNDCDVGVVHNGIIQFASKTAAWTDTTVKNNDTMEFTKEVLFPLLNKNPNYYNNKALMGLISYLLSGNRFAIMDKTGHVELVGTWIEDNGVFYSNDSYKPRVYYRTYSTYYYDDEYDEDGYEIKSNNKSPKAKSNTSSTYSEMLPVITKAQEKEFLDTSFLYCDECGEEMWLSRDDFGMIIATCPHCGTQLYLTTAGDKHAEEHGLVWDDVYYTPKKKLVGQN